MNSLYLGIDIGKQNHMVAWLSAESLKKHKAHTSLPTQSIPNSRAGFDSLLSLIPNPSEARVLLEHTGHYGFSLEQFLQEHGIQVYRMAAQTKLKGTNKSDKHDAQALAMTLYNQIALHAALLDESERVRPLTPPAPEAYMLRSMVHHRSEMIQERTRRENKLISIADEIFPELSSFFSDMGSLSCINLREHFPTPEAVAAATIDELAATRTRYQPSREKLALLQEAARATIGVKAGHRRDALLLEQEQLITEWRLLTRHIDQLEERITSIVERSRAGRIISSLVGISPIQAAVILAGIGHIDNFETVGKLRNYIGWSPKENQTGTSRDQSSLDRGGNKLLKSTLYFVAINAVKHDPTWNILFTRLVERKCNLDARTGKHRGVKKVYGRIAGQMIGILYTLLKKDAELVRTWTGDPGELPEPELYSSARHAINVGGGSKL